MKTENLGIVISRKVLAQELNSTDKRITSSIFGVEIPLEVRKQIVQILANRTGYETGPVFGLRSSGVGIFSLPHELEYMSDIFSLEPDDVVLQIKVPKNSLVSISMKKLSELVEMYEYAPEVVMDLLDSALCSGVIEDEEIIIIFLPKVDKNELQQYILIDDNLDLSNEIPELSDLVRCERIECFN